MEFTTVSQNDIPGQLPPDYTEQIGEISGSLKELSEKLDQLLVILTPEEEEEAAEEEELVSENDLPEELQPDISVYVTVSGNTISENTVSQNALITTPLKDYSLTDSLLLLIVFILLLGNVLQFIFTRKKGE